MCFSRGKDVIKETLGNVPEEVTWLLMNTAE
jgi:hypothetical protein